VTDEKCNVMDKRLSGSQSEGMETMYTTYRLKAKDLNSQFLESLKTLFGDQEVEITVRPVDETAYLLQSEANSLRLREAIANINAGTNLVEVPLDDLQ